MSDRALLSALEEIHTTRQRRALWPARRATPVSIFARVAVAAVLVVGGRPPGRQRRSAPAGRIERRRPPSSTPSPTLRLPPAQSAVDFPNLTTTFVSPSNGFSIKLSRRGRVTPAKELWDPRVDAGRRRIRCRGDRSSALSSEARRRMVPDDGSIDDWIDEYVVALRRLAAAVCLAASKRRSPSMGSRAGSAECPNEIEATVVVGGRLYLFTLFADAVTPEPSSTPLPPRSTCARRKRRAQRRMIEWVMQAEPACGPASPWSSAGIRLLSAMTLPGIIDAGKLHHGEERAPPKLSAFAHPPRRPVLGEQVEERARRRTPPARARRARPGPRSEQLHRDDRVDRRLPDDGLRPSRAIVVSLSTTW